MSNEQAIWDSVYNNYSYVSSDNGEIYIGNILVDECFDIQYAYREMKEPIYGYRSKYFNASLPGTVLITGQFTINYIHDAYLYAILNGEKDFTGGQDGLVSQQTLNSITASADKALGINTEKLIDGFKYKTTLQQYNELRKLLDTKAADYSKLTAQQKILDARVLDIDKKKLLLEDKTKGDLANIDKQKQDLQNSWWGTDSGRNQRATYAQADADAYKAGMLTYENNKVILANLSLDNYTQLKEIFSPNLEHILNVHAAYTLDNTQPDVTQEYYSLVLELRDANEAFKMDLENSVRPGLFNSDSKDFLTLDTAKDVTSLNASGAQLALDAQKAELQKKADSIKTKLAEIDTIKAQLTALGEKLKDPSKMSFVTDNPRAGDNYKRIDAMSAFQTGALKGISATRPEDRASGFDIKIFYNGMPHKTIRGVHLTGHSHLISGTTGQPIQENYQFFAHSIITEGI